jgi:hypothetical protein
VGNVSASESERVWAPLFLVLAAMWLPFVLLSCWASGSSLVAQPVRY